MVNVKKPTKKKPLAQKSQVSGIELKTAKLKEMVTRAAKGASNNRLIPLTSMMEIELKNNKLTLKTTDATNYLYILEDKVEGDDFIVTVIADTFVKLISRLTCETVKLELKGNALQVTGNGRYLIELPQEDGENVRFPNPIDKDFEPLEDDIQLTSILAILSTAKQSLANTLEIPCYTGYYCGDRVVATDTYKMCGMDIQLWEEPRLISPELMNLLSIMTAENISVDVYEDELLFSSPDCIVYGRTMEGIEEFAIDDINNVLDMEFPSTCTIKKSHILQLLDRISLFVSSFDKNEIDLAFTKEGIQASSKGMSGTELIKYLESTNFSEFTCSVDIESLAGLIKAFAGDSVQLWYGEDNALKLVEGNTIQVLSLQGEAEESDEEEPPFEEDEEPEDDEE